MDLSDIKNKDITFDIIKRALADRNLIPNFDEEWFNSIKLVNITKLELKDLEGYKYNITLVNSVKNGKNKNSNPYKFNSDNPHTINNIILYCKLNNKPCQLLPNQEFINNRTPLKYVCNICNNIFETRLSRILKNENACLCCGQYNQLIIGINDFNTKRPDLIKYFDNIKESEVVSIQSSKKLLFKCPICGYIKKLFVNNLYINGFSCPNCSPNISMPEKFICRILKYMNIPFLREYKILDYKYRYDFYLPDLKIIIETHGIQHYIDVKIWGGLQKQQEIDHHKKKISEENGFTYIEIDCRQSDFDFLKESCIKSLSRYYSLDNIDWKSIQLSCIDYEQDFFDVCAMRKNNELLTVKKISEILNIGSKLVRKYLILGNDIDLCNYNPLDEMKKVASRRTINRKTYQKQIIKLDMDYKFIEKYNSIIEASKENNIIRTSISSCCRNVTNSAGGFRWSYYNPEEHDHLINNSIQEEPTK